MQALTDVELTVRRGETLGIVGESGCGKSTLARTLVRLYDADRGSVRYGDLDVLALRGPALRQYNRRVQMIFQDPYSSLNPRMTVEAGAARGAERSPHAPRSRAARPRARTAGAGGPAARGRRDACRTSSPAASASASASRGRWRWNPNA